MEKYVESYYVVNPNSDIDIACLQDDLRDIEDYTGNLVFTSKGIFPLVDKTVNKLVDEGFEVLYEDEWNGLMILANDKDAVIGYE